MHAAQHSAQRYTFRASTTLRRHGPQHGAAAQHSVLRAGWRCAQDGDTVAQRVDAFCHAAYATADFGIAKALAAEICHAAHATADFGQRLGIRTVNCHAAHATADQWGWRWRWRNGSQAKQAGAIPSGTRLR